MKNAESGRGSEKGIRWVDVALFFAALAGFALNFMLFAGSRGASLAGCGGSEDCSALMASRWSRVFGIPVTVFGMAVYLGVMVFMPGFGRRWMPVLLGMILGAAGWLIPVQWLLEGKFCPWCMAAHAVGLLTVLLGFLHLAGAGCGKALSKHILTAGFVSFLILAPAQLFGPIPKSHLMESQSAELPDQTGFPRIGNADAAHALVEFFDYQCAACRTMSGFLEALMARHPRHISVILIPVPLDGACNPHAADHPGSCEIIRISLAVWKTHPEAFPDFHRALLDDPSEAAARGLALGIMSVEELNAAAVDPWIGEHIRKGIHAWWDHSKTTGKLPKLIVRDTRILHGLPSGEADFIRVMEAELGLGSPEPDEVGGFPR